MRLSCSPIPIGSILKFFSFWFRAWTFEMSVSRSGFNPNLVKLCMWVYDTCVSLPNSPKSFCRQFRLAMAICFSESEKRKIFFFPLAFSVRLCNVGAPQVVSWVVQVFRSKLPQTYIRPFRSTWMQPIFQSRYVSLRFKLTISYWTGVNCMAPPCRRVSWSPRSLVGPSNFSFSSDYMDALKVFHKHTVIGKVYIPALILALEKFILAQTLTVAKGPWKNGFSISK